MVAATEVVSHQSNSGDIVPSSAPSAKVLAASGGSAVGGALGTIMTWEIVAHLQPPALPEDVRASIALVTTALCSGLLAGIAGYFKRPDANAAVTHDAGNRPRSARRR